MSTVTIAVDLAKNVFEIAVAGRAGTVRERKPGVMNSTRKAGYTTATDSLSLGRGFTNT